MHNIIAMVFHYEAQGHKLFLFQLAGLSTAHLVVILVEGR